MDKKKDPNPSSFSPPNWGPILERGFSENSPQKKKLSSKRNNRKLKKKKNLKTLKFKKKF